MTFKAVLVDDERLARQELGELLAEFSQVKVVGEAKNLSEAVQEIKAKKPNLVFLDIQLRHENGFDLLGMLEHNFKVIFVTAFDEFALRAFDVNALDYLLKPVNPKRLKTAIDKLMESALETDIDRQNLSIDDQIFLNLGGYSCFLPIKTISHICASGDYSEIYRNAGVTNDKPLLVDKSLKEWEQRLPDTCFSRIHRSTIVNHIQIDDVLTLPNRTMQLRLKGYAKLFTVSRRYTAKFKQQFG